ncbi:MAG: hypothetical protein JNG82_13040 [Opitutaceae bacterium]|nr:hypothetical protein [Opitutaceae bacterium]
MKLRHFLSKFHRLCPIDAGRETALKELCRGEDRELLAQGRGYEIVARNRRLMGIRDGAKAKLGGNERRSN